MPNPNSLYDKHKINLVPVKEQSWWGNFENDLLINTPEIPSYSPKKSDKDWEFMSGMKEGYLLALSHLGVQK